MATKGDNPFSALEKTFHEPKRLAIMSAVCSSGADGTTFNELKDECDLTDGTLSRRLKTLEEAGMMRINKEFVGVGAFIKHLNNLETILAAADKATATQRKRAGRKSSLPRLNVRPAEA